VSKDLRQVLGESVRGRYSRTYCGGGSLDTCRAGLRASLAAATTRVLAEQELTDVTALTYDKTLDNIRPTTAGLVGTRQIDWQNRPTFQQVVAFTTHRPRAGSSGTPGPAAGPPVAVGQLPATGGAAATAVGAILLLGVGAVLRRRMRVRPPSA